MRRYRNTFVVPLAAALSACAIRPAAVPPQSVPAAFDLQGGSAAQWPAQQWYREFGSDELDALVDAAVRANLDVEKARARIAQADARARQAGAAILPRVDAQGSANYVAGHSSQGSGHEFDWSALLSASYEVDFWGRNRATADSARLSAAAARAERDTVALTTLAGVADAYFQLLGLRERLVVAVANRDAARTILDAVKARFAVAAASAMDVATQMAALDATEIAISDLKRSEFEARTALSLLLGVPPENFVVQGQPLDSLHEPVVVPGLPSELLVRRPDIFLAEAQLLAGHADLAAARAAMFPTLSLTAGGGVQSPAMSAAVQTIEGIGPSLTLGANLLQVVFDHGSLQAHRDEVAAGNLELLATYRASILAALVDVENALSAIRQLDQARSFQFESVAQGELALEGARLRYQAGATDLLALLDAQRTLYAARDQLIQYRLARLQALVGLCKALGGGWSKPEAASSVQNQSIATKPGP